MYIIDGIAYASEANENIKVNAVKVIDSLCLLITFSTGEKRIYDATGLLQYPVYESLSEDNAFKNITIINGIVTWNNGEIDIAPETLYCNSHAYEEEISL